MANPLMLAALEYEAKGYSVIPLKPRDKVPLIPSWVPYQVERADRAQIGDWWRTWPDANIGIVTGSVSGVVVIDCDSADAAKLLKPTLGDMSGVGIATTGKGYHLYYAHGSQNRANKAAIRPQVDFRGDGGYVVAAPSVHSNGKTYGWTKPIGEKLRELPAEFIAMMTPPTASSPVVVDGSAAGVKGRFDTAAALSGLPDGQRDDGLFRLASKLRGSDVPYDVALQLCQQAANNCLPVYGIKPGESVVRKVDQAYKYSPGHSAPVQETFWPQPLTAQQLIDLPPDPTRWVWLEWLPLRSTSALIAKPYTGKSTFAASLALAVSRGVEFLGRPTMQGSVLYVYLDGPQDELKENLVHIGLRGSDPIFTYAGKKPSQVIEWVKYVCVSNDVRLVIIDTAQKFFGFKEDKYEEKINAMQPMLDLASENNFHAMFTYHAAKNSVNTVSALGSIASEANARVSLYLRKKDEADNASVRLFDTAQNTGKRFEAIGLSDPKDGFITSAGSLFSIEQRELSVMIVAEIREAQGITEMEIKNNLNCRKPNLSMALRHLRETNVVERTGAGIKGAPFKYYLAGDLVKKDSSIKVVEMFKKD